MRVLILDNYDSFTWNLAHGLEAAGAQCTVLRSDSLDLPAVRQLAPDRIVLSPGPYGPERSGICAQVVRELGGAVPILGVCLGMQVIASVSGASVVPSGRPCHGRAASVWHDGQGIFNGVPNPFAAARYHSLIVEPASVPPALLVTARGEDGTILGCRQAGRSVEGVLFHPESFLTTHSARLFANFLGV